MEETTLGNLVNLGTAFSKHASAFRETAIPIYLCPSRDHDQILSIRKGEVIPNLTQANGSAFVNTIGATVGARGDYAGVSSTWRHSGGQREDIHNGTFVQPKDLGDGRFESRTSFRRIIDGLSKTIFVAENSYFMSARCSVYDGGDNPGAILGVGDYQKYVLPFLGGRGSNIPASSIVGGDIAQSPTQYQTIDPKVKYGGYTWIGGEHVGILNITLGDGSSRGFNKDADLELVEYLVTRNGGEQVSIDQLQ
jgi:hypothetical protein